MSPRRAARVDDNQSDIVETFRGLGCSVFLAHTVGEGFPDLVVAKWDITVLVEVKDPSKPPSRRKLRESQVAFHRDWKGKTFLVETQDDVLAVIEWLHKSTIIRGKQ